MSVDYLVVAGGGWRWINGGGGEELVAIVHLFQAELKLTLEVRNSYPITVGGGGEVLVPSGTNGIGILQFFHQLHQQVEEEEVVNPAAQPGGSGGGGAGRM
jgi:hypothetical protein